LRPAAEFDAGSPRFDAASLHSREDDAENDDDAMRLVQTAAVPTGISACLAFFVTA
jgi:hypothetical protein